MRKNIRIFVSPIVWVILLIQQQLTKCSYLDITILNDALVNDIMQPAFTGVENHLTINDNYKLNKRNKKNNPVQDDISLLTNMLAEIIPAAFAMYSLDLTEDLENNKDNMVGPDTIKIIEGNNKNAPNDYVHFLNFYDFVNIYDKDINNTISKSFNTIKPIKGCEEDIKNNNCNKDNVLKCITLKKDNLSERCKKSLNNSLLYSCSDGIIKYCDDFSKFSKVHKCLKQNHNHLNNNCINILSYYESIMQKLHKIKNKPYNSQEHFILEKPKEKDSTPPPTSDTTQLNNNNNDDKNNKYNMLNHDTNIPVEGFSEKLRKRYGYYIHQPINYSGILDLNFSNYQFKYFLYFFGVLFFSFLLYILVVSIKKYCITSKKNLFGKRDDSKLI
ncbi:conserved Plasmodium protein, unknown function [Plasmodium vinckei brucechwatti]|uniref:PIR protein CIR protein n=1 Tax=Plasmodium vinckei brucechwatti TaxID=119398 RepID=A0A6V7SC14_PLAVN|nr:conserved Plasmodium protein, unknown function [Plasmodium vinckei brucechwatti]